MEIIESVILVLLFARCTIAVAINNENLFELSIIHINDFHARYEETSIDSGLCKTGNCIGGFSRLYTATTRILNEKPHSIVLNAGDNFEGTLWHNIHKGNATQYFFNKLPFDAFTLGNHEFDDKLEGLISFLKLLKCPVVVANIDTSRETFLQGLISKSTIVTRNSTKIGIIGVIASKTIDLVDIGNLVLLDESASVNEEAVRLAKEEGVFTNIVLSHCGYNTEQKIAKNTTAESKISLIVGGHSHSFLYSGEPVPGPDIPAGSYPTTVRNLDDKTVLVVQASAYSKYLGNITVVYNADGDVVSWDGKPIFLDNSFPQDNEINKELLPWKEAVDLQGNSVIGYTLVRLEQSRCQMSECLMGNFITDAMVFAYTKSAEAGSWTNGSIAIMHAGGLRSGIDIGSITYNEIVAAQPFGNTIDIGELKGRHLKNILESSTTSSSINLLQVSGVKVVYDLQMPEGSRVTSLLVRCRECDVPVYGKLEMERNYRLILPSFLANGGFGFTSIKTYLNHRKIGKLDVDLFTEYIETRSPIYQEIEGRIQIST